VAQAAQAGGQVKDDSKVQVVPIILHCVVTLGLMLSICAVLRLCRCYTKKSPPATSEEKHAEDPIRPVVEQHAEDTDVERPEKCVESFIFACCSTDDRIEVGATKLTDAHNDEVDACNSRSPRSGGAENHPPSGGAENHPLPDAQTLAIWMKGIYSRYNPHKVATIDELLERYCGKEDELIEEIVTKYRLGPCAPMSTDWPTKIGEIGAICT